MSKCTRSSAAIVGLLVGTTLLWFSLARERNQRSVPGTKPKLMAETLLGSWRMAESEQSDLPALSEVTYRFDADGNYRLRVWDAVIGTRIVTGAYRVEEQQLLFLSPKVDPSPLKDETWDVTYIIESITDDKLVLLVMTKRRWKPARAQELSDVLSIPVEGLLAEVRESRSRNVYYRTTDE